MRDKALELALRRQRLEFEAAASRRELAEAVHPFEPALHVADKVGDGFRYLKGHPEVVAVATVVVAVLRPGRAVRWGRRAFSAWRAWGKLRQRIGGA